MIPLEFLWLENVAQIEAGTYQESVRVGDFFHSQEYVEEGEG